MGSVRDALLADTSLRGAEWCQAFSTAIDEWLADLLEAATGGNLDGVALVAVGGYGRAEMCPGSDIDLMLAHDRHPDIASMANLIWYPIWDTGLKLGHSVCTPKEAMGLAADNLDTATALLNTRHVAGDRTLTERLAAGALAQWERRSKRWLTALGQRVDLRHEKAGEVAFQLEPDLKEGRGGLRDVHSLHWAEAAHRILLDHDSTALEAAYASLLEARVELHRLTGRPGNVLVLQNRDPLAAALGEDPDTMMARLADAGRTIAWTSDDTWRRIRSALRGPLGRVNRRAADLGKGLRMLDGEVHLEAGADPAADVTLALRAATAAATNHTVIERHTLERLAESAPPMPDPWPPDARRHFIALLLAGPSTIAAVEALDQRGVWQRILPEWIPVRARPQRNAFHRFTVDRHLLEATANAAALSGRVDRPDLLVVASLFHDLGKGYPGDHSEVGADMAERVTTRMGFAADDVATVSMLVRHHLLLSEVATRRDLEDPVTIERVAAVVGNVGRLRLLTALTEADSVATGPAAWSSWKAGLLARLVAATERALTGRDPHESGADGGHGAGADGESFPSPALLARLAEGGRHFDTTGDVLTVMTDDHPGIFSRVAGVLALHGLDVLEANAHSTEAPARADPPAPGADRADPPAPGAARALARFRVVDPIRGAPPWDRVVADLELALDGRLALDARLAERARAYANRTPARARTTVTFDNGASAGSTVIDVHTANGVGVLYRITRALTELHLDIRSARIGTIGDYAYDAFYVRDAAGRKITDSRTLAELEKALVHSLTSSQVSR